MTATTNNGGGGALRRSAILRLASGVVSTRAGLVGGVIIAIVLLTALLAPLIAPYDPVQIDLDNKLIPPSAMHLMGTDQSGRDILSRVIWGSRASLQVGILAVIIGLIGGVSFGMMAGYYSGRIVEQLIMRTVDALFSIPMLVWAIAIVGIVGVGPIEIGPISLPNEAKVTLLVGFLYVPAIARVTYAAALVESKADYVLARRIQGATDLEIILGEVLRNCWSPVIVQATLFVAIGIIVEASLSFVGLGVQPPKPSWGTMLADARGYVFSGEWWLPVFPGLAISFAVIGFNLLGDALRDLLDPRKTASSLM